MSAQNLKPMVEAILMAADGPVTIDRLLKLLDDEALESASRDDLRNIIEALQVDYAERGIELVEVASGYRFQARAHYADYIARLWHERRPRYSRALLETLAIIAYRQPITRGEIEHIRGVAVATSITRTLLEREWVRVVGHRDVPGRPALYATTKQFLDYFGLKTLDELPSLAELKDIDDINADLFANLASNDENLPRLGIAAVARADSDGAVVQAEVIAATIAPAESEPPDRSGDESAATAEQAEPSAAAR
jgi:segregation and condensation protein B